MRSGLKFNEPQHRGLLPNLQNGLRELDENEKEGIFWRYSIKHKFLKKCDVRYHNAEGCAPPSEFAVDNLLLAWFR
jgi:hypothetical protein